MWREHRREERRRLARAAGRPRARAGQRSRAKRLLVAGATKCGGKGGCEVSNRPPATSQDSARCGNLCSDERTDASKALFRVSTGSPFSLPSLTRSLTSHHQPGSPLHSDPISSPHLSTHSSFPPALSSRLRPAHVSPLAASTLAGSFVPMRSTTAVLALACVAHAFAASMDDLIMDALQVRPARASRAHALCVRSRLNAGPQPIRSVIDAHPRAPRLQCVRRSLWRHTRRWARRPLWGRRRRRRCREPRTGPWC